MFKLVEFWVLGEFKLLKVARLNVFAKSWASNSAAVGPIFIPSTYHGTGFCYKLGRGRSNPASQHLTANFLSLYTYMYTMVPYSGASLQAGKCTDMVGCQNWEPFGVPEITGCVIHGTQKRSCSYKFIWGGMGGFANPSCA